MTAFFKPLAFSPCADCAKIAAGIPKAINAQNTSLSLICRCQLAKADIRSIGRYTTPRLA